MTGLLTKQEMAEHEYVFKVEEYVSNVFREETNAVYSREFSYHKYSSKKMQEMGHYDAWNLAVSSTLQSMRSNTCRKIHALIKKEGLPTEWRFDLNTLDGLIYENDDSSDFLPGVKALYYPITYFGEYSPPSSSSLEKMKTNKNGYIIYKIKPVYKNYYNNSKIAYFNSELKSLDQELKELKEEHKILESRYNGAKEYLEEFGKLSSRIGDFISFIIKSAIAVGLAIVVAMIAGLIGKHILGNIGEIVGLVGGFLAAFGFNWVTGLTLEDNWDALFLIRKGKRDLAEAEKNYNDYLASPAYKRLKEIEEGGLYDAAKKLDDQLRAEDYQLAERWQRMWFDAIIATDKRMHKI